MTLGGKGGPVSRSDSSTPAVSTPASSESSFTTSESRGCFLSTHYATSAPTKHLHALIIARSSIGGLHTCFLSSGLPPSRRPTVQTILALHHATLRTTGQLKPCHFTETRVMISCSSNSSASFRCTSNSAFLGLLILVVTELGSRVLRYFSLVCSG